MKNYYRFSILAVAALGIAAAASAQDTKPHPFKVELGAYFPTFSSPGISKDTGATFALGYTFGTNQATKSPVAVELELRGRSFRASDSTGSATLSVGEFLVNGNLSSPDGKLFYGVHLGFGRGSATSGNVTISDDNTRFIYGAQAGYNFTPQVYGIVRYSTASQEVYRGVSVGVGYRF
jgi:hypothetical protein